MHEKELDNGDDWIIDDNINGLNNLSTSTLRVKAAKPEHEGKLTIEAKNEVGMLTHSVDIEGRYICGKQ